METKLTSQQKGRCGELLAQYMLLKHGIESAPLTTDTGIDLVAYPRTARSDWPADKPVTIQVKTSSLRGKEERWLEFNLSYDSPADYICAIDLERNKLWIFTLKSFKAKAKHAGKGNLRLWWSPPGDDYPDAPRHEDEFLAYEMDDGIRNAFGSV